MLKTKTNNNNSKKKNIVNIFLFIWTICLTVCLSNCLSVCLLYLFILMPFISFGSSWKIFMGRQRPLSYWVWVLVAKHSGGCIWTRSIFRWWCMCAKKIFLIETQGSLPKLFGFVGVVLLIFSFIENGIRKWSLALN